MSLIVVGKTAINMDALIFAEWDEETVKLFMAGSTANHPYVLKFVGPEAKRIRSYLWQQDEI